jgi:hypothetical protein
MCVVCILHRHQQNDSAERVLLEKVTKKFPAFYEPGPLTIASHEFAIDLYSESN